ncbi:RNA pseudouridine synthase 5 [Tanacetum coccineum]
MNFLCRHMEEESSNSHPDILSCPFLRNINEPTNFSFTSSVPIPLPVRGTKGPIFEDGPSFDTAFSLFHGQNGVVPLSEPSSSHIPHRVRSEPVAQQFHPLAARAATISLSGFGGPFGFDAFSEMFKNQQRKHKPSKKESNHEAMGEEWLQNGKCPMAKSYRSVTNILPIISKAIKLPSGINYRCPPVIVAARAALAKTAFAKNLRPQPLPEKVLVIGAMGMAANVPLGIWREHTKKFSPSWFAAVHAAVPFIAMLRKSVLMPKSAMAFTIAASVLGQVIGSRAERYRLKAAAAVGSGLGVTSGLCGEVAEWEPASLQVSSPGSGILEMAVVTFGEDWPEFNDGLTYRDIIRWLQRIQNGQITVDGTLVTDPNTLLRTGSELVYHRLPWKEPYAPHLLEVLFEDDHLIALNKPSGLQVLPGGLFQQRTVLTQLQWRIKNQELCPVPVHRLGRGTSGILLCAKTKLAKTRLAAVFADKTSAVVTNRKADDEVNKVGKMSKIYRALASGIINEDEIVIDQPIGTLKYPGVAKGLYVASPSGKPALSRVHVLKRDVQENVTVVQVEIQSGRPHQIRIHLSFIGHPLIGDPLYVTGGKPQCSAPEIADETFAEDGPANPVPGDCGYYLHAHQLVLCHPMTNEAGGKL